MCYFVISDVERKTEKSVSCEAKQRGKSSPAWFYSIAVKVVDATFKIFLSS